MCDEEKTNDMRGKRLVDKIWTLFFVFISLTRILKQQKAQQKKYYKPVEGEEPSFESLDRKLSNKFFELFGDNNNEEYEDSEGFDIEDV